MKSLTFIVLSLLLIGAGADRPKAVIILIDGVPADVVERVATPNLDEIAGASGYTRAYVGGTPEHESESPTVSAVSYNSLLTGTWSNKNNVWTNSIQNPNYDYWDIFRIAKNHDRRLRTALYSTWTDNRTKLIGDGLEEAGGSKLDYYADGFELDSERFPLDAASIYIREIDAVVTESAAEHLYEAGPDLAWVYLQYTDDVAHFLGDSPELDAAVILMDQQIGQIWESIKHRQLTYDEDWMIVVTTDHGRDAETGRNHGGQSERERTIWIVTNHPGVNDRFRGTPAIVDILPSVAAHLDLVVPAEIERQLDGSSFIH